jgi:hypothetical protein
MLDVIDFLEGLGQDAQWRHADPEALTRRRQEQGW